MHKTLCRYMVTKKVVESASETDDETEVAPKPEVKKAVNKKEVIFPPMFLLADELMTLPNIFESFQFTDQFPIPDNRRSPCSQEAKGCRSRSQEATGYCQFLHQKIGSACFFLRFVNKICSCVVRYQRGKGDLRL